VRFSGKLFKPMTKPCAFSSAAADELEKMTTGAQHRSWRGPAYGWACRITGFRYGLGPMDF
jgi:hypothetical protein